MKEIAKYILISIIILAFDGIWIASNYSMYSNSVLAIQHSPMVINYYAAVIAYALVIFTSLYIAIPFTKLHIEKNDGVPEKFYKSLMYGGTVGLAVHGIYNTTSMAIYKGYEARVAVMDTIWGTVLNTLIVFIYFLL